MTDDFKALKARIDLAEEIKRRTGLTTKEVGDNTLDLAECPFCHGHDCFRIDLEKQTFKCFQGCNDKAGDVFDFVQRYENCSAEEALRSLAEHYNYELTKQQPASSGRTPEEDKALNGRADILEAAASYYHAALFDTARAIGYQRKVRRHTDEALKAFRVGYADGRLLEHLTGKGFSQEDVLEAGLAKTRNGRVGDFFIAGLYIYPHADSAGRIAGFTCKDPKKKYEYRLAGKYWGPDCLFFNMPAFEGDKIFLVEGENDLLSVCGRGGLRRRQSTARSQKSRSTLLQGGRRTRPSISASTTTRPDPSISIKSAKRSKNSACRRPWPSS
jgi:DNA primase